MKKIANKILAVVMTAMLVPAVPMINASADEKDYKSWGTYENGVYAWTFTDHGLADSGVNTASSNTYNFGYGMVLTGSGNVKLYNSGISLGNNSATAGYIKFTPTECGTLTISGITEPSFEETGTITATNLFLDTENNASTAVNNAFKADEASGNVDISVTGKELEKGVDYYIYNKGKYPADIKSITFTPFTDGSYVWDLTNVTKRIGGYLSADFANGTEYNYTNGLKIAGGGDAELDPNRFTGVSFKKNGSITFAPNYSGILYVEREAPNANEEIYVYSQRDKSDAKSANAKLENNSSASIHLDKLSGNDAVYYIWNGSSTATHITKLKFTPDLTTKATHVGVFPEDESDVSKQATAYSAEFDLVEGTIYTSPTITWEFDFADNYDGATGKHRLITENWENVTGTEGKTAYGLVVKDQGIGEDDATVTATFEGTVTDDSSDELQP